MDYDDQYIKDLELTLTKFLKPVRGIPFSLVVKSLSGFSIIPFNKEDDQDIILLRTLERAMEKATKLSNENGISASRVNEVGNYIEPYVKNALNDEGFEARTPLTKKGKPKSSGYPDLEIIEKNDRRTYLECKTFNIKSINSTQRTFYFSPSDDFKITFDARHLLVSFEVTITERNNKSCYVPISWNIYTLDKLKVDVKNEFNASNRTLYLNDCLLSKGKL